MRTDLITSHYPVTPYVKTNHDVLPRSARSNQGDIVSYEKASILPQAGENENPLRRGVALWESSAGVRTRQPLTERIETSSAEEAINAYQRVQEGGLAFKSRLVDLYA